MLIIAGVSEKEIILFEGNNHHRERIRRGRNDANQHRPSLTEYRLVDIGASVCNSIGANGDDNGAATGVEKRNQRRNYQHHKISSISFKARKSRKPKQSWRRLRQRPNQCGRMKDIAPAHPTHSNKAPAPGRSHVVMYPRANAYYRRRKATGFIQAVEAEMEERNDRKINM